MDVSFESELTHSNVIYHLPGKNNNVTDSVTDSVTDKRRRADKILELVKNSPTISVSQIAGELGVSSRTIKRDIALLQNNGKLKRSGSEKHGRWEVVG